MISINVDETIYVAHRGASNPGYTENTVLNFEYAINSGYDYIECDIRFSSDNVPYLYHNDDIIENQSSTELGSEYSTLEETISLIEKYDITLVIEIKEEMTVEQFELINELCKLYKDNIIFQVSSEKNFSYLYSEGYQLLVLDYGQYSIQELVEISDKYNVYIGFDYYALTSNELQFIDENMDKDVYWTINNKSDIDYLINNYTPCAIITDLPNMYID